MKGEDEEDIAIPNLIYELAKISWWGTFSQKSTSVLFDYYGIELKK